MKILCIIVGELRSHIKRIDDFYDKLILPNKMDIYYYLSKEDNFYREELLKKIGEKIKGNDSKLLDIHFQDRSDDIDECKTMIFRRFKDYVEKKYCDNSNLQLFLQKLKLKKPNLTENDYQLAEIIAKDYYGYLGIKQWYKLKRSLGLLNKKLNNYTHIMRIRPDIDFNEAIFYINDNFEQKVMIRWDFMVISDKSIFIKIFGEMISYYEKNGFPSRINREKIEMYCEKTELKNYVSMFKNEFRIYSEHILLNYLIENGYYVEDVDYKLSIENARNLNDKQIKFIFESDDKRKEKMANEKVLKHHNYEISIRFLKNEYRNWRLEDWYEYCKNKNIIIKKSYFYKSNEKKEMNKDLLLTQYFGEIIYNII